MRRVKEMLNCCYVYEVTGKDVCEEGKRGIDYAGYGRTIPDVCQKLLDANEVENGIT